MADNLLNYFRWVESKNNDLVKQLMAHQVGGRSAAKLRKEQALTLLEGTHLLDSWYRAGHSASLKTIITNPASVDIPEVKELITSLVNDSISNSALSYDFVLLKESLVKAVSAFHTGPFLLALVEFKNSNQIELNQDLVILDGVQDAGNVGNILRTSAAAGFRQIICLPGTACPWSNKVLRAGMGAQAVLEISEDFYTVEDISHLPIALLSTQLQGKLSLFEMHDLLSSPVAWVFGNEGFGVSKLIQDISQGVRIPQESRVESLNVASAAAICLFETLRVRLHRTA